ncbi:MAG: methylenetetrahydrofolate--tRNA-(uracil(54)-C(5))-methyltransferase (FADH(2)-oxidizing) TrmFO [Clostridia bacterium]|nr:methylenetetrahydrofolate--tRNA-(uracil(54)-C(5))-methyltransferase (FADH(2)-oxidizing) TrmFO [Clostridia bacterium]
MRVTVIGGGLAGCEATYQIAKRGIDVILIDAKPIVKSPAHKYDTLAELVCSNSLKSNDITVASGLLKQELRLLDSLLVRCADSCRVPAGSALAVQREQFSVMVTQQLENMPHVTVSHAIVKDFVPSSRDQINIVATGPLTLDDMLPSLRQFCGDFLHFYDAVAPIVTGESIDYNSAFSQSRYDKGDADYLNCPMNKDEFINFWQQLTTANTVPIKHYENNVFEGCMPIEVMASRGIDTIRYGMFKPVGLTDKRTGYRPYAVLQLRRENTQGTLYNLVGCQTHLTFGDQKRVFSLIPALANADFVRYGVMHRNTYINSPTLLNQFYQSITYPNLFFAGQLTGVEGYVESIASGLVAGINVSRLVQSKRLTEMDNCTMIGALARHVSTPCVSYQPMNANFGLLPPLANNVRDKKVKYSMLADISLARIKQYVDSM